MAYASQIRSVTHREVTYLCQVCRAQESSNFTSLRFSIAFSCPDPFWTNLFFLRQRTAVQKMQYSYEETISYPSEMQLNMQRHWALTVFNERNIIVAGNAYPVKGEKSLCNKLNRNLARTSRLNHGSWQKTLGNLSRKLMAKILMHFFLNNLSWELL